MSPTLTPRATLSAAEAARRAAAPQAHAERRPVGDLSLERMRLRGRTISTDLRGLLTDAVLERTIEGASTLTLSAHDSSRRLMRSGVLHRGAELTINGLGFVLVAPTKEDDTYTLTFEDREVWALRQHTTPTKAARSARMTRARFIEGLIRAVRRPAIGLWAPERDIAQPVAASDGGTGEPYEFTVGTTTDGGDTATTAAPADEGDSQKEDYWAAIRRLADEVHWRAYMAGGVLHLARDRTILAQATRWAISERTPGIDRIAWTIDEGQVSSEATVTCQAQRWGAPPGGVVRVTGEGPADGLWIVSALRRPLSSVQAQVTLTRPREALPEPASAATVALDGSGGVGGAVSAGVASAYRRASEIHAYGAYYLWGGGHGNISGNGPFDCSGGVSNVMGPRGGGFISATMATPGWNTWGQAGEGQSLTVWVRETGVPEQSHVFLEFRGFPNRWWEAGGIRGARTGWRAGKSTAGFSPRHQPGT